MLLINLFGLILVIVGVILTFPKVSEKINIPNFFYCFFSILETFFYTKKQY